MTAPAPQSQPVSEAALDAGAKALRKYEMAGRITVEWDRLPKSQKRKWWGKAQIVLAAAGSVATPLEQEKSHG